LGLASACGPDTAEPAGQGLVLVRSVEGSNEIVRVRLRDAAERAVTSTPEREESWPFWSSDAGQLVFQVGSERSGSELMLWSSPSGERPLTQTANRVEHWPVWSPMGSRLAYAFLAAGASGGITVVDTQTGESRVLANEDSSDQLIRPGFSPDGASLVMQRRGAERGSSLWIARPGLPLRPLTAGDAWFDIKPYFSRDGERIFFSRRSATGGPNDVMSVTLAGNELRSHTSLPDADDHSARPSPTRDEIAFVSNREGYPAVYLAPLPDGPARRLSPPEMAALAPRWSADGERILVTSTPASAPLPRLSDPASLTAARVAVFDRQGQVLLDAPGMMPDWMPAWP